MAEWAEVDHKQYFDRNFRQAAVTIINDFLAATKPGKKQITIQEARERAKMFIEQIELYYPDIE